MKKLLVVTLALFVSVVISGAVLQKTGAQVDVKACQKKYNASRSKCIADNKTCNEACGDNYDCKLACNLAANACEEAATDQQRKCSGVWPYDGSSGRDLPTADVDTQPVPPTPKSQPTPPVTTPKSPGQSSAPTPTVLEKPPAQSPAKTSVPPQESPARPVDEPRKDVVEVDLNKIAGYKSQVKEEAKKIIEIKKCLGSPLPSENPCVAEKLNFILAEPAESYLTTSFLDKKKTREPIILDNSKKREVMVWRDDFFRTPPMDLTKLNEMSDLYEAMWKNSEKNFPKSKLRPEFQSPFARAANGSTFEIALVGEAAIVPLWEAVKFETKLPSPSVIVTGEKPVQIITPDKTTVEFKGAFRLLPDKSDISVTPSGDLRDLKWEILDGGAHVDKSNDGKTVEVQTPLTTTKSKHTKFSVLYNPEELFAATIVYEGEVEVTDILNGLVTTLTPTEDGRPRALVVPLAETGAAAAAKKSTAVWIAVILLVLAIIGYLVYRKKDAILKIIKKEPK